MFEIIIKIVKYAAVIALFAFFFIQNRQLTKVMDSKASLGWVESVQQSNNGVISYLNACIAKGYCPTIEQLTTVEVNK